MSDSQKRAAVIAVVVVALVAAVGSGYMAMTSGETVHVVRAAPPPTDGGKHGKAAMMANDNR